MIDTIKLKKPMPKGSKSEFEDVDELREYLNLIDEDALPDGELGVLYELPEEEITEELRKKFDQIDRMDMSEFIDI